MKGLCLYCAWCMGGRKMWHGGARVHVFSMLHFLCDVRGGSCHFQILSRGLPSNTTSP